MEALSIGGLASGLDTNAIIDGLTDLELAKVKRVETKQKDAEVKLDAFNDLKTRIADFSSKADGLNKLSSFNLFESDSSDDKLATISGGEDAVPGTYQLEIESLATEWKVASKSFSTVIEEFGFTGKFEISKTQEAIDEDPMKTSVEIEVDTNDTLKDLVNKINSSEGAGARASIISLGDNDFRLVLSAVEEGTEGFHMKDTGAGNVLDSSGLDILSYQQQVYSDFNFRMDTIGAAQSTTTFDEIFSGIGGDTGIDAGDEIDISGTDSNGNAVAGTFTLGAGDTIQNLLDEVKTVFESQGATVDVDLNTSGEVVITDTSGGVQEMTLAMTFNDANASGSELRLSGASDTGRVHNIFNNVLEQGKKAFIRVDGLSVASEGNKNDSTINGTTFNLKKAEPGEVIELSLERDTAGIKEKIQSFLDSYNSVMKFFDEKTKVVIENEDEEDPNKKAEIGSKGPFAGDSSIYRIKTDLRNLMTSAVEELSEKSVYTSLASIGITSSTTSAELKIDDEKFDKALKNDFDGVRRLFMTSGYSDNSNHKMGRYNNDTKTGIYDIDADNDLMDEKAGSAESNLVDANRTGDVIRSTSGDSKGLMIDAPTGSGTGKFTFIRGIAGQIDQYWDIASDKYDGHISHTRESIERRIDSYKDRVGEMADKVEAFRQRLIRQFAGLEDSISRLQSQSGAFQAQLGGM